MTSLVPILTANQDKGFVISASSVYSNFQPFKMFDVKLSIDDRYTSNKDPLITPQWVQVEFPIETIVNSYSLTPVDGTHIESSMPINWTFSASKTGLFNGEEVVLDTRISEKWNSPYNNSVKEFSFFNKESYKYYRLTWRDADRKQYKEWTVIGEMQLYNRKISKTLLQSNNKAYSLESIDAEWYETKMTSNTTPSPFVVSASSINSTTYDAWKAFDGVTSTAWVSKGLMITGWIQINYGSPIVNNILTMHCNDSNVNTFPKDFTVLGSNDGISFTKIADFKNQINWKKGETREYQFANNKAFSIYRLDVSANNGATTYININELKYGYKKQSVIQLPVITVDNFIDYGNEDIKNIDNIFVNKNYILQDTVSENSDGLWETRLDRKPLNIRLD